MKLLFLIADGMGGWADEHPGGKTCLEAAHTPVMDEMASTGVVGVCRTVPEGMPPGSDVANMSLLGFDPARHHTGRGPIEAAAQGIALDPDDLVWRMNLVNLTELSPSGTMLDYSSGHIATEVSAPLVEDLQAHLGDETFRFIPGVQYRHLLVHKGGASEPEASLHINPPHDITDKPIRADMREFSRCPRMWDLLFLAEERLRETAGHTKARSIWPWGQGRPLLLPGFAQSYALKGAVISAVDLVRGLGRAAGMEVVQVPGATGLIDTNYEGKVEAALAFLEHGDFAFVHLEGPDECGHAGDAAQKAEAISRFDARVVAPLRRALADQDVAFLVTCDHFTPIVEKTHTPDPVPFLLWRKNGEPNGLSAFSEVQARGTGLVIESGHELLPWILRQLRAEKA
ncbi:2,3-bisphosphoglycerate-independent phosphoglycerate mutase [Humidesulfovibrio mexicanus]|uniref:2,3-bisphosphoglycerate-independent phosphoglycerate mutase n=1 Tax=Humidesulfovibrio mexicanus TaxID=147047 RepID=A0A238ZDM5_9BACT|nr:cofactor-independent phosphoglycerate mutase [Humidesulfovibrio mexicanus]SNR81390.1 2,3-bisphosphoglycerate-independent phosphoglycerate mutase [Humidesulfovibrio mexicanus]